MKVGSAGASCHRPSLIRFGPYARNQRTVQRTAAPSQLLVQQIITCVDIQGGLSAEHPSSSRLNSGL